MKNLVFFRQFMNISQEVIIDFSVGVFEGVISFNFTSSKIGVEDVGILDNQTSNAITAKSKVLAIAAGGAVVKAGPKIVNTIVQATPFGYY